MFFASSLVLQCCKSFISFLDSAMVSTTVLRDPFVSYFHVLEDTGLAAGLSRVSSACKGLTSSMVFWLAVFTVVLGAMLLLCFFHKRI